MNRVTGRRFALLAVPALALVASSDARAGDFWIHVRFANMTPDAASTPESKKCVATLRERPTRPSFFWTQYVFKPIAETPLRKLIGAEDRSVSFMTWTRAATKPAWDGVDAFLAVDCRPEEGRLDALLVNASGERLQFRARERLDRPRIEWISDEIFLQVWEGYDLFSPPPP